MGATVRDSSASGFGATWAEEEVGFPAEELGLALGALGLALGAGLFVVTVVLVTSCSFVVTVAVELVLVAECGAPRSACSMVLQ